MKNIQAVLIVLICHFLDFAAALLLSPALFVILFRIWIATSLRFRSSIVMLSAGLAEGLRANAGKNDWWELSNDERRKLCKCVGEELRAALAFVTDGESTSFLRLERHASVELPAQSYGQKYWSLPSHFPGELELGPFQVGTVEAVGRWTGVLIPDRLQHQTIVEMAFLNDRTRLSVSNESSERIRFVCALTSEPVHAETQDSDCDEDWSGDEPEVDKDSRVQYERLRRALARLRSRHGL